MGYGFELDLYGTGVGTNHVGIVVLGKWLMTQTSVGQGPPNKTAMEILQER